MGFELMEISDFKRALDFTVTPSIEGGFVDDPLDPGGATNFGITQHTYDAYRAGRKQPVRSVKFITQAEVATCYLTLFWIPSHAGDFPGGLSLAIFDTAVQWGPHGSLLILQEAAGPAVDADLDSMLARLRKLTPEEWRQISLRIYDVRRARRYARVKKSPTQIRFLPGWLRRDALLYRACLSYPVSAAPVQAG